MAQQSLRLGDVMRGASRSVSVRLISSAGLFAHPFGVENPRLVHALVCMRAEEIALRLQQIRRQTRRTIAVEIGEGSGERRHGHAVIMAVETATRQLCCVFSMISVKYGRAGDCAASDRAHKPR